MLMMICMIIMNDEYMDDYDYLADNDIVDFDNVIDDEGGYG